LYKRVGTSWARHAERGREERLGSWRRSWKIVVRTSVEFEMKVVSVRPVVGEAVRDSVVFRVVLWGTFREGC